MLAQASEVRIAIPFKRFSLAIYLGEALIHPFTFRAGGGPFMSDPINEYRINSNTILRIWTRHNSKPKIMVL